MENEYKIAPVEDFWLSKYGASKYETKSTFTKPTRDRKYVKILALCLTYAPAKLMYPNTTQPLMHQVRDMCRHGLLQRYTKEGSRAYYYKTTDLGRQVLLEALED